MRRRVTVARWILARMRRSQASSSFTFGVKWPRMIPPPASMRARAMSTALCRIPIASASAAGVNGPMLSTQPRTISNRASSSVGGGAGSSLLCGVGSNRASGNAASTVGTDSAATQAVRPPAYVAVTARPSATSAANHSRARSTPGGAEPRARAASGRRPSVSSASWSSSASRTNGQASAAAAWMAASSSLPSSRLSSGSALRRATARDLRSSSGASSRKA